MKESKRAQISNEQEAVIAKYALDFPDMNRTKLAEKIQAEVNWSGKAPEVEVLERKISSYRKVSNSPEDLPWNLDALIDHPVFPSSLQKVLSIWLYKQESPYERPLSIRQVRWITQLSSMTDDIELLRIVSDMCAEWELIGELTGIPQLSSPATVLFIYSILTRMNDKELNEHHKQILREKHMYDTLRSDTVKGLGAIYGNEFLKATKLKSKEEAYK